MYPAVSLPGPPVVRETDPAERQLRPAVAGRLSSVDAAVRETDPAERQLRPRALNYSARRVPVRETDPAERQLRLDAGRVNSLLSLSLVRETDPAERQLRPTYRTRDTCNARAR